MQRSAQFEESPTSLTEVRAVVEAAICLARVTGVDTADPAALAGAIAAAFIRPLAELDQARAALADLHAGEELPEDEQLPVTPAQWLWHLNRSSPDERLEAVQRAIEAAEAGYECALADHSGQTARLPALQRRLAATEEELSAVRMELRQAEAQRGEAVRFIALLAGQMPAFRVPLAYRSDPADPVEMLFLRVGGQLLQWCIEARDRELFGHVAKPPSGDSELWLHRMRCTTPEALRDWAASSTCAAACCSQGPASPCACGPLAPARS